MCSHGLTRFSAIAYVSGTKHLEIQLTQRFMAVPAFSMDCEEIIIPGISIDKRNQTRDCKSGMR